MCAGPLATLQRPRWGSKCPHLTLLCPSELQVVPPGLPAGLSQELGARGPLVQPKKGTQGPWSEEHPAEERAVEGRGHLARATARAIPSHIYTNTSH